MIQIAKNEVCNQCDEVKEEVVDATFKDGNKFKLCEECLDSYLEGRIRFLDFVEE